MSNDFTTNTVVRIDPKLNCCRVCLKKCITEINLENSHILELLEYCVSFKVDIKHTSHVLCVKCEKKIKEFANFKRQFIKTERHWENLFLNKHELDEVKCDDILPKIIKEEPADTEQNYEESNSEICTDINDEEGNVDTKNFNQSLVIVDNKLKTCSNVDAKGSHHDVELSNGAAKIYKCTKCRRKYSSYKWLLKHSSKKCCTDKQFSVKTEKKKVPTKECGLCDKQYSDLKEHIRQHWLTNNLECGLCNYCGKDFAHMVTHRYTHYPKLKIYCIACDKRCFSMLSLQFHFRSVHLQKPGGYCTFCDKTFNKFKTWKKHHRIHTESNSLYVCDHCGYKFLYRHEMKIHMLNHLELRQYVCETCGKGFKRISSLREHTNNLHRAREPVTCGHCNKVYKCEKKLRIHLRNLSIEKPYICEVCSKQFPTETVLNKHMFWHSGERPFTCEECGLKYKAKTQLKVHMRKHSGVLPFACVHCNKRFASSTQLKRHKSVHTGVRAHKCEHCERSFHLKKGLLEHVEKHKDVDGVNT